MYPPGGYETPDFIHARARGGREMSDGRQELKVVKKPHWQLLGLAAEFRKSTDHSPQSSSIQGHPTNTYIANAARPLRSGQCLSRQ